MNIKHFLYTTISVAALSLVACKGNYEHNAAGFKELNEELKSKFGAEAYYTIINMSAAGDETMGYTVFVDKTDSLDDIRQERWVLDGGSWMSGGFANMQVDRNNPNDYKFQLDKEVKVELLGQLITDSKAAFIAENKGDKPVMKLAQVNTNTTVTDEKTKYRYTVKLAQSGTNDEHSYTYDRDGKLIISN